jgi:hypothetical protein
VNPQWRCTPRDALRVHISTVPALLKDRMEWAWRIELLYWDDTEGWRPCYVFLRAGELRDVIAAWRVWRNSNTTKEHCDETPPQHDT